MTFQINLVDTGVLLELLEVPGKAAHAARYQAEFKQRYAEGQKFILPIATIIETGNHICQAGGDRAAAAKRFHDIVTSAVNGVDPFVAHEVAWDAAFITALLAGDSTGEDFVKLAGDGRFGGGDVSILVERDRYLQASNFSADQVRIWTTEELLGAYA